MKGLINLSEVRDASGDAPILEFVGSTDNPVRDGSILSQDWQLKEYRKNPVMLYGHDHYGLPIAKTIKVWKDNGGEPRGSLVKGERLLLRSAFVPEEIYPHAYRVYRMYQEGFLNAVSVGFRPQRRDLTDDEKKEYGITNPWAQFLFKPELLEYSAVTVPMDPNCLKLGIGLTEQELRDLHERRMEAIIESTQFAEAQAYFAEIDCETESDEDSVETPILDVTNGLEPRREVIEVRTDPALLAAIKEHTETLREAMALGAIPVSPSPAPGDTETHSETPEDDVDSGVAVDDEGDDDSLVEELAKLDEALTTDEEVND